MQHFLIGVVTGLVLAVTATALAGGLPTILGPSVDDVLMLHAKRMSTIELRLSTVELRMERLR